MSLKAELETWAAALKAYDEEDFENSLELFSRIADSSKILTNMGLIYATLGEHEAAVERFIEATNLDQYLAVAYFQCGVSNFLLERYDLALKDFDEALLYLRGNQDINYEQLGLKFRLYSAEVLFNKGLSQIYLDRLQEGLADMEEAKREKATEDHNVIDDAIKDGGEGYTVFSIPIGTLYRPSEKKLKNSVARDYMGKAKLVASSDPNDDGTAFSGATRLKKGMSPAGLLLDRPDLLDTNPSTNLLRSATVPPVKDDIEPTDIPKSAGFERSKSSYTPSNTQDSGTERLQSNRMAPPKSAGVTRNNTQITTARPSPNAFIGGQSQARGSSIRRPGATPNNAPPPVAPAKEAGTRMSEIYDDYLDSYGQEDATSPPGKVDAWVRSNSAPRSGSRTSSAPNQYAPSSYSGKLMSRKSTRRGNPRASRVQNAYEDEEEGYGSGEYDDGPIELSLIRVKLHYEDDVRGMTLTPDTPFSEFMDKVVAKFYKETNGLALKFKDEDGGRVSLRDESDYELAIETARDSAKGKAEGKLEIWCSDM
ncbi:NADPH oxidase regulator NoxR [Phlegmacium glaucopus]|nr:NADPH oxidase regulator NoxR [Phlegmacium glaucopus]